LNLVEMNEMKFKLFFRIIFSFTVNLLIKNASGQIPGAFPFPLDIHSITVPFELHNNHIYVKVKINGSKELDFLFDNGAGSSGIMIDSALASEINLVPTGKVAVGATGGSGDFLITDSVSLQIDKLFVAKQKVAWLQLKEQEKEEGHKIDGILSYSFFKFFVFEIDYKNECITISDPKYFDDAAYLNKLKMIDLDKNRVPIVKGTLFSKTKTIVTTFIFDTGHDEYMVLGKQLIKKYKLAADTLKVQPERVNIGLGGETNHKIGKIRSFKIGKEITNYQEVVFAFDKEGFYSTLDGVLLGGAFFKNYTLVLNYPKQYIVLFYGTLSCKN
jgi:predicted aspartyl protease